MTAPPLLLCDDVALYTELLAALPQRTMHLAVNVLHAPLRHATALVDEPVSHVRTLVDERLMRLTWLMRLQVEKMAGQRGLVVNVLCRSPVPDALANAIDDGIVALTQVVAKSNMHLSTLAIIHGRVPLRPGMLCRIIRHRMTTGDLPWGDKPIILDGGADLF